MSADGASGRRVAVTAVGVICGLGAGSEALVEALRAEASGAREVHGLPAPRAVPVRHSVPELPDFPDDRKVHLLAFAAGQLPAIPPDVPPERRALYLGTGLSSVTPRELEEDVYPLVHDGRVDRSAAMADLATDRVAPWRHLPARATGWLAERLDVRGPSGTTFSACAAGAEAIAAAARSIVRGEADVAVAGGHDSMMHPLGLLSFEVLGALGSGRPFDRDRDGFILGEGAALLLLESEERVRARGVTPLAWWLGAGSSLDAHGITAPHPEGAGAEASMRRALREARLDPSQVDWVSAHGTGTPLGDQAEARAIARVFGDRVPVSSLKGAAGHTLAAAGAVEAVAAILSMSHGFVHGTVGCTEVDELGVPIQLRSEVRPVRAVVSNSFGFGGQNCSLVFAPGQEAP